MNKGKYAEDVRSRMVKMMENEKNVLYSFAKFPTEIIEDKLFVVRRYRNQGKHLQLEQPNAAQWPQNQGINWLGGL